MIVPFSSLALAAIVSSAQLALAISPADIPSDVPVAQLIKTANIELAKGNGQDALTYFDVAITRDPQNYLTLFKRGAAYLSLGKSPQARKDFDKVLAMKPGFEGALLQRAKLRARGGEWTEAEKDFLAAGKKDSPEIQELREAQGAAMLAAEAAEKSNWEECVQQAGVAIMVAGALADLRKTRSRCRFEQGQVAEGVSDLMHLLQISSGDPEPYLQVSAMKFYALGETAEGLTQVRKCLQSDPDSKACRKLMKREKQLDKSLKKVQQLLEKRQFVAATKLLVKTGEEPGLLKEVKDDFEQYSTEGLVHKKSPQGLYGRLVDTTCEAYWEMNNLKKARPYCEETLQYNPTSLFGLLSKGKQQIEADDLEAAMSTLNEAEEYHPESRKVQTLLHEASTLLRRSKQKDYYKVLGLGRDADERDIKKAFRKLTLKFHPDKAAAQGITPEDAQKKMSAINEAYEILSDPELKARYDQGDDPNDQSQHQGHPFQGSPFGGHGGAFHFQQGGQSFHFQGGGFPF
ncbi:TPR-like protein [Venturia nashicola]|uniref:Tetratricopeptide repeat and J domain-containing co-chaperone DNJ1 n=1 Tax=Venturia nashicola TaxID=86259 RepID=A0A4Z1NTK0_9PEZI|nr:TPR-like protein [Venturia nashicola]TLD19434.1 TPR-like protein [Venturia nashicola]